MVESGMIDKYAHMLDMERAVYDTIMLDNAVRQTRDWAKARGDDTLILVLADHNHPNALVGTINDDMTTRAERAAARARRGLRQGRFPELSGARRARAIRRGSTSADGWRSSRPACRITTRRCRPKLDGPNEPTEAGDEPGTFKANEKYKNVPGAVLRFGNLPAMMNASVHSGEDVILTATGPGSDRVHGSMDNTEVFRVIAEALGLGGDRTERLPHRPHQPSRWPPP